MTVINLHMCSVLLKVIGTERHVSKTFAPSTPSAFHYYYRFPIIETRTSLALLLSLVFYLE